MESPNVETHRAGHEAFNQRDFAAMTKLYSDSITWTDHAQGRTFERSQQPIGHLRRFQIHMAVHAADDDV